MRLFLAILLVALLPGCASITMGTDQTLNVDFSNCMEAVNCTATNKKGTWTFTAPGPVTVDKSDDQLVIRCEDGEEYVTRAIAPNSDEMVWGNVILGGGIGAAIDSSTDAHWELPNTVTLVRQSCRGEPAG